MPYKSKGKCVYKKDTGKKVGCTTGSVKKYLAALHANVKEESIMNIGCEMNDVENFSDEVRNMTVGELLNQVKGNNEDLYRSLVRFLRETYQEFDNESEGPPEPIEIGITPPPSLSQLMDSPRLGPGPCGLGMGRALKNKIIPGADFGNMIKGPARIRGLSVTKRTGEPLRVQRINAIKNLGERKKQARNALMVEAYKILHKKGS